LQCPDKDELVAVLMKLLEEHRGEFWPDFIAVMLMAGARRGALGLISGEAMATTTLFLEHAAAC
jgi:hypothetical protein